MTPSERSSRIDLVCLDMAGTTVKDDGAVEQAFLSALEAVGVGDADPLRADMLAYVQATMGTSKITVFRSLFGDEGLALEANTAFEKAYEVLVTSGRIVALPGAAEAIAELREAGKKVALLTGFSKSTRDALLDALGWRDLADLTLCPAETGRGRPYPDMVLTALLRLEVDDVAAVAVAGDTASDIECALRAGASVAVGVLTGADGRDRLLDAGATHVLASVSELPELVLAG
ncbi:MAG: Haloacid dehalogenase domain protein hydrolase [Acidimicrobiaceae bacterium]|nr:Haloacid dehalogenase domain protein hydrolase [Acidimicrobiaceae bacterium]